MNKVIITMISIIMILGIIVNLILWKSKNNNKWESNKEYEIAKEEIFDDCTDEYEQIEEMIKTNSNEVKTSPNCAFIFKDFYENCGHTVTRYSNIPENMVNKTKEEIKNEYKEYEIEKFESNEVIFVKSLNKTCDEHYLVKGNEGKVTIFKLDEEGNELLFEKTEIATDYLTETDKINMKNGIKVNGKQELNQLIEDFE